MKQIDGINKDAQKSPQLDTTIGRHVPGAHKMDRTLVDFSHINNIEGLAGDLVADMGALLGVRVALVEGNGGQVKTAGDVAVEAQQGACGDELQCADDDNHDGHPLRYGSLADFLTAAADGEHPDGLPDVVEQEQNVQQQQHYEHLVVERADAIVEVDAVVVEVLGAPVASLTVVTLLVDVGLAQPALRYFLVPHVGLRSPGLQDVGIHWVEDGDAHVYVHQAHHQDVVDGEHDPQDGVVNFTDRCCQEYRMQDHHQQGQAQGQHLLHRRSVSVGVRLLVRALSGVERGPRCFILFFAQPHCYYSMEIYFISHPYHFANHTIVIAPICDQSLLLQFKTTFIKGQSEFKKAYNLSQGFGRGFITTQSMDPPEKNSNPEPSTKRPQQTYIMRTEQLPEIDPPTPQQHPNFYKVKTRISEGYLNIQLGLLVTEYQHFQQDFVVYLTNLLMCELQFLNASIVEPMHLYLSVNATAEANGSDSQSYLRLENDLYYFLNFATDSIADFLAQYVSEGAIFGEEGPGSQEIIQKFQQRCVKPIKQMHAKLFNKNDQ